MQAWLQRLERALIAQESGPAAVHAAWLRLVVGTFLAGLPYGCVIGWWTPRLALYTAVKFPIVLLATSALTFPFAWIAARRLGLVASTARIAAMTVLPLFVAAATLASLAPVVLFFTIATPRETATHETAHHLLYLMHVGTVGSAGTWGVFHLRRLLPALCADPRRRRALIASWIVAYAFVGGEIAWILRPFVGSPFYPVELIRADALRGNVYEFIAFAIVPHLLHHRG